MRLPDLPVVNRALLKASGVLAVVLVGVVVLVVVRSRGDDAPQPPEITSLRQLAAAHLSVPRGAFCDRVRAGAVQDALDREVTEVRDYRNGDTAQLDSQVEDVAHEFGCTWTSITGAVARAWVFAPPVTTTRGKRLAKMIPDGCTTVESPGFGDPTSAIACETAGQVTAGHRGLFGDAWLSCTVSVPLDRVIDADAARARADDWCMAVAVAAAAPQ